MKWVVVMLTVLSVWPTVRTLVDAHLRCRRLVRRGLNGLLDRDCRHNRRRESVRILKHILLMVGVLLAFVDRPLPGGFERVEVRTGIMIAVSWLLGLTSISDRRYTRRLESDLAEREGVLRVQT